MRSDRHGFEALQSLRTLRFKMQGRGDYVLQGKYDLWKTLSVLERRMPEQKHRMQGMDIEIMSPENVVAIVEEESFENPKA